MRNALLCSLLLLAACNNTTSATKPADASAVDSSAAKNETAHPYANVLDTIAPSAERTMKTISNSAVAEVLSTQIPEGWVLLDTLSGDLNRDTYTDLLLILKRADENDSNDDLQRPLLVFTGTAQGLQLAARNDNVVLCKNCGGIWGDPYSRMVIKNGYFSIEHYGGSNWRWTRIITFKYNDTEKTWYLHRDAGVSYNNGDPEGTEEQFTTHPEDFGKLKFTAYDYNK